MRLEINWAEGLWAKFPLVGSRLEELRRLRRLEIVILPGTGPQDGRHCEDGSGAGRGWKREGQVAEMMLKAEKKMFEGLVEGMKALRYFRLEAFADEEFAKELEGRVACRGWI